MQFFNHASPNEFQGHKSTHQHNYTKGRDAFIQSINLDPQFANGHANLGISYYSLGQYDSARVALEMAVDGFRKRGLATPHDVNVAGALAVVLSGDDTDIVRTVTEDDLLRLERRELTRLTRSPETIARVKHMLKTGKPLRN